MRRTCSQVHRGSGKHDTRVNANCPTGERLATGVLAIGARSAVSLRRHTSSLPPNRCAAHPEPFSCVDVDVSRGLK